MDAANWEIMYRSTKSKGLPSTSRLPRRQIQILASGSTTASCRWMVCCLSAKHVEIAKSFSMRHMHPSWVDFPAQVDAQVHSVLRSHPPEEVVLQMRKQDDTLEIVVMHYVPWDGRAPQGSHRPEPGLLRRQLRNAGWVPRGWRIPTWHDWHMRVSMNGDTQKWINDLWVPPFLGNLHHTSYMCIGPGCPIPKVAPKMLLIAFGRQQATYQIGNFALCNSKCAI